MTRIIRFLLSFIFALAFLLLSYWVTNLRFPLSGEKDLLSKLEFLRDYFRSRESNATDSVVFINLAYDKELCPVMGDFDIPDGYLPVTNRKKLLDLLTYLKAANNYKYILLDVFFTGRVHTKWDEQLYETILSMQRIVIPSHGNEAIADQRLMEKAGLADYLTTFSETDFVKYPYFSDEQKSLPVKMYEEVTGNTIVKHGLFYTDGMNLVRKCIVLTYDLRADSFYSDDMQPIWRNLGTGLLGDSIPGLGIGDNELYTNPYLVENKYVVIGSFQGDDTHSTFAGEQSGSVILFNAFISLLHGHHKFSVTFTGVLFLVFFFLCYMALSKKEIRKLIDNAPVSEQTNLFWKLLKTLNWLYSWIGLSVFLSLLCIATYFILDEAYDIFVTSTVFYVFNLFLNLGRRMVNN